MEKSVSHTPMEFRPVSFWSWNDRLDEAELSRQIAAMKEQGWGGFFMHARGGLETEYLSEEWMARVRHCVQHAAQLNMQAWLYDEDTWPSGMAGGKIPALRREYRETHLFYAMNHIPHHEDDIRMLKVYRARKKFGGKAEVYRLDHLDYVLEDLVEIPIAEQEERDGQSVILYFYQWTAPLGNPRFGGSSYVDLMNAEATAAFIDYTHERYKRVCGEQFGNTVRGIFTDDLTVLWDVWRIKRHALPWTDKLPEQFEETYGYSLLGVLPLLYLDLNGHEKVRFHYYKLVNHLFASHYTKLIGEWCRNNGLISTGHLMGDGSGLIDFAQHYAHMQYPATDHLGFNCNHFLDHRLAQSVASQLGKPRVVSEAFAATGQGLSFEEQKWVSDWLFIHGINMLTMHLSAYSLRGERKRDHPPTLSLHQPWWDYNGYMADYQSRVSQQLNMGRRMPDLLVIHNVESMGIANTPLDNAASDRIRQEFISCLRMMLTHNFDYELGSEELIEQYGHVKGSTLYIGEAGYTVVFLPRLLHLRKSTLDILESFVRQGGKVITMGALPGMVDGEYVSREELHNKLRAACCSMAHLEEDLIPHVNRYVRTELTDGAPAVMIYHHLRSVNDECVCFLANHDRDRGYQVKITIRGNWQPIVKDLTTGRERPIAGKYEGGLTCFLHHFPPGGSVMLLLRKPGTLVPDSPEGRLFSRSVPLPDRFAIKWLNENSLLLDRCRYAVDKEDPLSAEEWPCLTVRQRLAGSKRPFRLKYRFRVENWDGDDGFLVMEEPQSFCIVINGQPVAYSERGHWIDRSFKKIPLQGLVVGGENTVELQSLGMEEPGVESVYIIGDFGVYTCGEGQYFIDRRREASQSFNLTEQGSPFYAGKVELSQEIAIDVQAGQRVYVRLRELHAVVSEVWVNGSSAGIAAWQPYTVDITDHVKKGLNTITFRLASSLRNLLGPHYDDTRTRWVSPASFHAGLGAASSYLLNPLGIKGAIIEIME